MAADKKSKKLDKTDKATDKQTALENALKQIEKQYGAGAIMRLGENKHLNVAAISTGSLSLDIATGINGLPKGRIVEIYVAEAQKAGGQAAFIDAEHALDPIYAANLGVDVDSLLVAQPDYGEQALEIAEQLARSGAIDIIVVDSVAALVPRTEIDDDMGDSHVGLHARLMSQAMRKLAGAINKSNTLIIFINQLREKVGVVYGNPEVTTGGRALKFYASMRIDVRKGEQLKNSDNQFIGSRTKVKIVKNKVAPPFRSAEFDIMYGTGISKEGEILDLGVEYGVIKKGGSWFSYGDRRLGQGRDNVKQLIKDEPEFAAQLEQEIKEKIAEVQATSDKKYQPKAAPKADTEPEPAEESTARQTRAAARAKLDIAVEDDDE